MHPRFTRRDALLGTALSTAHRAAAAPAPSDWLLTSAPEIDAARTRTEKFPWVKTALDDLMANARQALRGPVALPDRGGQWPHWYTCKLDGVRLETVSPTEHRCPKCNAVYRGEPYDSVILYNVHSRNSRFIRDLGLAYRFTGDTAWAARASALLTAYAERYSTYPRHNTNGEDKVGGGRIMAQTLDESVWLIPAAWGYALVRDSMDPAARTRIERDLFAAAAEVIREHRMGIHNIQCWKNSAVGLAGFVASRDDLVADAIDNPDRGFRAQVAKGITEGGLWYEGSLGYHQYTMEAIWPLAEAARRRGIDLYSERLASMWDAPLALAFPDGTPPGYNDNNGSSVLRLGALYELAYARWRRPAYGRLVNRTQRTSLQALLYGVDSVPEGPMIPTSSSLLPAGFAMLRAGSSAAAMRFGLHGGGHGHPDKLNLVTWGAGAMWGLDPGSIAYGAPLHREWYRTTIAHNTVTVDGASQANVDGKLVEWKPGDEATTLVADAGAVYPGVTLTRTVTLRGARIDDRFTCASETEHTYDWAFHAPGRMTTSLALTAAKLEGANGYQHIEGVQSARNDGAWWARWEAGGRSLTLRVEAAPGTEVFTGAGPGKDPAVLVPLVIVRRRAKNTTFAVMHEFA